MIHVRPAAPDDVDAMGVLHVRAWQATYRDVMSAEYLDGLDPAERAAMWRQVIALAPERLLVADDDGTVVGFAALGPEVVEGEPSAGELYALNVDPQSWRRGAGRALLAETTRRLNCAGWTRAVLWVVPSNNRARRFYEASGWAPDGTEREAEVQGVVVPEVRYAIDLEPDVVPD